MNRSSIPAELLSDVKNFLDITWEDEAEDKKISGLIAQGSVYLDGKYGEVANYETEGLPRTLLMEYVRYARDRALDVFENNYQSMILAMQNERAVMRYSETMESAVSAEQ